METLSAFLASVFAFTGMATGIYIIWQADEWDLDLFWKIAVLVMLYAMMWAIRENGYRRAKVDEKR